MSNSFNVEERIALLEAEIKAKKDELKSLKYRRHIDYSIYRSFRGGLYDRGCSCGLAHRLSPEISALARSLAVIYEETRNDGSKYLCCEKNVKIKDLSFDQISFCNEFVNELYPIIEKYANKVLR